MADLTSKKSNHISNVVQGVESVLKDVEALKALYQEAGYLGYTDPTNGLQDADFTGANSFLSAEQYRQVMATLGGLSNQMDAAPASGVPSTYSVLYQCKQ